jgi:hypothetical protein
MHATKHFKQSDLQDDATSGGTNHYQAYRRHHNPNTPNRYGMRRHFVHRHFHDTITIMEEGQLIRCPDCGMFCTLTALATTHRESAICKKGAKCNKQKQRDLQCI